MKLTRICDEGDMLPAFYGIAWMDFYRRRAVCLPVPLNVVAGLARAVWLFLRHGYRAVPVSPRDAYAQGLRDAGAQRKETQ